MEGDDQGDEEGVQRAGLDSNRPYKAAALCPVTVASLMSTLSVTNGGT